MDYEIAKYLHLVGLMIWVGMIPYEVYAAHRAGRTSVTAERLRLIQLANRMRLCQEYPCIVVVVSTGVWLMVRLDPVALFAQEWFVYKVALLAYLVFAEVYLSVRDYLLEKTYRETLARGETVLKSEPDGPSHIVIGSAATVVFFAILFCAVFKYLPIFGVVVIALAVLPPTVLDLQHLVRWKATLTQSKPEPLP